jgi:hypothetical protein
MPTATARALPNRALQLRALPLGALLLSAAGLASCLPAAPVRSTPAEVATPKQAPAAFDPAAEAPRTEAALPEPSVLAAPPRAGTSPAIAPLPSEHALDPRDPLPALPEASVVLERTYKLHERPRHEGAVLAAGEDELLGRWNVGGTGDPNFISNRPNYHPGARVIVDTELAVGSLPKSSRSRLTERGLLAQSRSRGYWPLRICFEDALRRDADQHGKSKLRLSIAASGRVTRARLRQTELDAEAGDCLRQAAENLRYAPGPTDGAIAVDLAVDFWPGDAPVPSHGPPPDAPPNPGTLAPDLALSAVTSELAAIERCYAEGLARDAALWGRVELVVRLTENGRLESVAEGESRFPDSEVTRCITGVVSRVTFPAPRGGPLTFVQAFRLGQPTEKTPEDESASASRP